MFAPEDNDAAAHAPNRRLPRRIARLVHIDRLVMQVLETHLDRIDRRAPLPSHAVDAVNAALRRAAPVCARLPRRLRPGPFPRETPLLPADAFLALLQIHDTVNRTADAQLDPPGSDAAHSPF